MLLVLLLEGLSVTLLQIRVLLVVGLVELLDGRLILAH
jgi:hypothetical protein